MPKAFSLVLTFWKRVWFWILYNWNIVLTFNHHIISIFFTTFGSLSLYSIYPSSIVLFTVLKTALPAVISLQQRTVLVVRQRLSFCASFPPSGLLSDGPLKACLQSQLSEAATGSCLISCRLRPRKSQKISPGFFHFSSSPLMFPTIPPAPHDFCLVMFSKLADIFAET